MSNSRSIVGTENGCSAARTVERRLAATGVALAILAVTAWVPRSACADEPSTAPVNQCEQFGCVG
jgi:hypothetical protein